MLEFHLEVKHLVSFQLQAQTQPSSQLLENVVDIRAKTALENNALVRD